MTFSRYILSIALFATLMAVISANSVDKNGQAFLLDLQSVWRNRPIINPFATQSVKSSVGKCINCHDSNDRVREAALSSKQPVLSISKNKKEVWTLNLSLERGDGKAKPIVESYASFILGSVSALFVVAFALICGYMYYVSHKSYFPAVRVKETKFVGTSIVSDTKNDSLQIDTGVDSDTTQDDFSEYQYSPKSVNDTKESVTSSLAKDEVVKDEFRKPLKNTFKNIIRENFSMANPMHPMFDRNLSPTSKKNKRHVQMTEMVSKLARKTNTNEAYKNDLAFVLYVCNIVETRTMKKDNINKKKIVIDSLNKLFSYNDEESKLLERNIEFLHSNGLIKKDTIIKQMQSYWGKPE